MRTLLWMIGRLLVGLSWIYCVGIAVLALLWLAGVQGIWWLDLANVFALCLFVSKMYDRCAGSIVYLLEPNLLRLCTKTLSL